MQNCMKLSNDCRGKLIDEIRAGMAVRRLSLSEISHGSGVDQSQVSRILSGKFTRLSQNIMQICKYLDMDVLGFVGPAEADEIARRRIASSALALWDGTPQGAEILVTILNGMAAMRVTRG